MLSFSSASQSRAGGEIWRLESALRAVTGETSRWGGTHLEGETESLRLAHALEALLLVEEDEAPARMKAGSARVMQQLMCEGETSTHSSCPCRDQSTRRSEDD